MSPPDRPKPDPPTIAAFEQLCHEVSNPLMVISGHTYILTKEIHRLPHLPAHECELLIKELANISQAVETMARYLDNYREDLVGGSDNT